MLQAEASACNKGTTQNKPHQISNTQRTENKTTDVVIQQHSRKLLMMDILKSETCWARKKWNKIASDIKLVFHSSTIKRNKFYIFWVWVCVLALVMRHAEPMRPAVLSSVSCLDVPYFSTLSYKRQEFRKIYFEHRMCFDFLYNVCLKYFSFW